MLVFKRRLYQLILRLHPTAFRTRFAREMSLDFEDALATYGFSRLLLDATRSLARQWITLPAFSAPQRQAPVSSHPLLAGHYLNLDSDNLTPYELLRGSLLFAILLFTLAFALNHSGNYIHASRDVGFAGGFGNPSQSASAPRAVFHASTRASSQTLVVPTSSLPSRYGMADRNGHTIYANPAAEVVGRPTESWKEFLLRCAIISVIVWLTSFLMRRTRSLAARVAFVSAGLSLIAFFAVMPLHLPDTSAQAEPLYPGPLRSHFESATIHLSQDASATHLPTLTLGTGASANLVYIHSSIRSLLAQTSNMPPDSIVGGPAWLDTDSYDITARVDPATFAAMQNQSPGLQRSQVRWMEQELLVNQFHLKLHVETGQSDTSTRTITKAAFTKVQPVQVLVIDSIERPSEN